MTSREVYDELVRLNREISLLSSCGAVLEWDHQVNVPARGAAFRAGQLSLLAGLVHEKATDPRIGGRLSAVEASELLGDPESLEAAVIRELRHTYDKETRLPRRLVEELNRVTALAHNEWAEARRRSDFSLFLPWLEKIVDLTREKAQAYGYEGEPYSALLDDFERGATVEEVSGVLEELKAVLVDLLGRIRDARKRPDASIVQRTYDVHRQSMFCEMVACAMGFDFREGRMDVSTHPFTAGIGPGDTRITTRYSPQRFNDGLFGTIHEAGHALYEMGLDKETHLGTALGEPASLGIHESQSRMWENLVGRSREFWAYFLPLARGIFRESLEGVGLDDFYGAVNCVAPSYIRVEADEVTYNLHVLLRFELERELVNGDLKPADVPGEWNDRFRKYLGMEVDTDANGCLQDVHWSAGMIGYFPTYALGNIYAAQFYRKARAEIPDLPTRFESGDFRTLREWLRENIHRHGLRYRARDLCQKVTGEPLSHWPLADYLNDKFGEIYGL